MDDSQVVYFYIFCNLYTWKYNTSTRLVAKWETCWMKLATKTVKPANEVRCCIEIPLITKKGSCSIICTQVSVRVRLRATLCWGWWSLDFKLLKDNINIEETIRSWLRDQFSRFAATKRYFQHWNATSLTCIHLSSMTSRRINLGTTTKPLQLQV